VGRLHGEAGGFIGGDDALGGRRHLRGGPVDRSKEVDVVTDPVDDLVCLDGVAARQGVTEVVGERAETDADEAAVQFIHYAAAAAGASSGKRACQAAWAGVGRNRSVQCRRNAPDERQGNGCISFGKLRAFGAGWGTDLGERLRVGLDGLGCFRGSPLFPARSGAAVVRAAI